MLPWLGFQGPVFTVSASATSDGRQSQSTTTAVAAYPMPGALLNTETESAATLERISIDGIATHHDFPGVIGRIAVVIAIPKIDGRAKPGTLGVHNAWTRTEVDDEAHTWLYRYVTKQSHHTCRTGPLDANPDRGPAPHVAGQGYYEFWSDFDGMPPELVDRYARFFFSIDGDAHSRFTREQIITL